MRLIVGLGNPGEEYTHTRHNAGFILINNYSEQLNLQWTFEPKFNSMLAKGDELILIKPHTFMNNSGDSVQKVLNFYKISPQDLIVIHDDVDLAFGMTKVSRNSDAAGHHGVLDIIEKVGTKDFTRIRVGVGRPENKKFDVADYVLSRFTEEELSLLENVSISDLLGVIKKPE